MYVFSLIQMSPLRDNIECWPVIFWNDMRIIYLILVVFLCLGCSSSKPSNSPKTLENDANFYLEKCKILYSKSEDIVCKLKEFDLFVFVGPFKDEKMNGLGYCFSLSIRKFHKCIFSKGVPLPKICYEGKKSVNEHVWDEVCPESTASET